MIKVLIVDDDKLARLGLISLVPWEKCGMTVVGEASNGERALAFLAENEVDLCVVDLAMPVMPGLEFIQRSKQRRPALQYVILSFHEDFENVQAAMRLGTLDYISKMRLEQNDCEEVFMRVGMLMRSMTPDETEAEPAPEVPAEKALQADWLQFYWLYSQDAMETLLARTAESGIAPRVLEHLLVRLSDRARDLFHTEPLPPVPAVSRPETAFVWLLESREILCGELRRTKSASNEACIFRAVEYIRRHLSEPLSMHEAAGEVGISRSYFAATFKKVTGLTFNTFIRQERVRRAKELLQEGGHSFSDISHLVGYEDEHYFCRVFMEQTGHTPSSYLTH